MFSRRLLPSLNKAVTAPLLWLLLLRAAIPLGYMPGNLLAGEWMVLCPGSSAETYVLLGLNADLMRMHEGHNGGKHQHANASNSACPIGTALHAFIAATPDNLVTPDVGSADIHITRLVSLSISTRLHPYRSRAPPFNRRSLSI